VERRGDQRSPARFRARRAVASGRSWWAISEPARRPLFPPRSWPRQRPNPDPRPPLFRSEVRARSPATRYFSPWANGGLMAVLNRPLVAFFYWSWGSPPREPGRKPGGIASSRLVSREMDLHGRDGRVYYRWELEALRAHRHRAGGTFEGPAIAPPSTSWTKEQRFGPHRSPTLRGCCSPRNGPARARPASVDRGHWRAPTARRPQYGAPGWKAPTLEAPSPQDAHPDGPRRIRPRSLPHGLVSPATSPGCARLATRVDDPALQADGGGEHLEARGHGAAPGGVRGADHQRASCCSCWPWCFLCGACLRSARGPRVAGRRPLPPLWRGSRRPRLFFRAGLRPTCSCPRRSSCCLPRTTRQPRVAMGATGRGPPMIWWIPALPCHARGETLRDTPSACGRGREGQAFRVIGWGIVLLGLLSMWRGEESLFSMGHHRARRHVALGLDGFPSKDFPVGARRPRLLAGHGRRRGLVGAHLRGAGLSAACLYPTLRLRLPPLGSPPLLSAGLFGVAHGYGLQGFGGGSRWRRDDLGRSATSASPQPASPRALLAHSGQQT